MIRVKYQKNISTDEDLYMASVSTSELMQRHLPEAIFHKIAQAIADRYVLENFQQVVSKLDQNAIANLVLASASKKVIEDLGLKSTKSEEDPFHDEGNATNHRLSQCEGYGCKDA